MYDKKKIILKYFVSFFRENLNVELMMVDVLLRYQQENDVKHVD
jgi:hypothetical protein